MATSPLGFCDTPASLISSLADKPFDLIVADTLSRAMGGADENTAPAIADLMANLDVLRRATGTHIMLIHRFGKNLSGRVTQSGV